MGMQAQVNEKSREERLLETMVTSGGVRLQPTRDVIQGFFMEASKLNALALSHALEAKLQSHMWQVFDWCVFLSYTRFSFLCFSH